jgi:hypothetical protein
VCDDRCEPLEIGIGTGVIRVCVRVDHEPESPWRMPFLWLSGTVPI